jgi:hypothetical protein
LSGTTGFARRAPSVFKGGKCLPWENEGSDEA